jgi:hypothetical protein
MFCLLAYTTLPTNALLSEPLSMKPYLKIALLGLCCLFAFTCVAQSLFSFGVKNALGVSPNALHATHTLQGETITVKPALHYVKGVAMQYIIGNTFGIETGLQIVFYSYRKKGEQFFFSNDMWVEDIQVPLLLVLKRKHVYNASREYNFFAGTSVEWIEADGLIGRHGWLKNLIAGVRIGSSNTRNGRLEYGLEYQYSLSRFLISTDYYNKGGYLESRLNLLSFNLVCYFLNKRFGKTE